MARPKKKPEYNSAETVKQIMEAVTDAYLNPTEGCADEQGHTYLNLLGEEFSMTPIKVRKLLITSGAYETPLSTTINKLYREGKTVKEIQQIMGLSSASVNAYLPYNKSVTGPKMLGSFGASYLYPIFKRIGVISDGEQKT